MTKIATGAAARPRRSMLLAGVAMAALLGGAAGGALAQAYPTKPIRMIVPFPPGSAPDQIARITGQHMSQTLGQPIVVDNKPGAQGAIGAAEAARAPADGYTLFNANNTANAANPSLFRKLPYDPKKDFAPVARFITAALMLVVRPDFPAKDFDGFLANAKANPGKLSAGYASAGMQVSIAELKALGGVDVLEVPYKGVPQAVNDILGGNLAFTFADYAVAFPQVRGGKVRGLGVTSKSRSPLMPEMPAIAERLPGFDVSVWNGLVAPAGTPREAIARLADAVQKALAAPEVAQRLTALGLEPAPMGPDEFGAFIDAEIDKWARQVKRAGIQPE